MVKVQPCLAAALAYLARGWSVLPLCPPDHAGVPGSHETRCHKPGKAPIIEWTVYQERLPRVNEVRLWWDRWPTANVGVALGPVSNLVAIDVDGPEGAALLVQLAGPTLPSTPVFRTPGGGLRYLFAWPPEGMPNRSFKDGNGKEILRIQGKGCQTVMPPSRHMNGGYYERADR